MSHTTSRTRAWLELMRISNLPTVVSTALAGGAIGAIAAGGHETMPWGIAAWSLAAPPLAYIGGMILNDAFDAAIDAAERPARPIPSGRIARAHASIAGGACLALAVGAAAATGSRDALLLAAILAAIVILYDALHARSAFTVILLGASRALACLVPMVAFADHASDADGSHRELLWRTAAIALPAMLAAWTVGLSIAARGEARADRTAGVPSMRARMWQLRAIMVTPLLLAVMVNRVVLPAFDTQRMSDGDEGAWMRRLAILGIGFLIGATAARARGRMAVDPRLTPFAVGVWIACLPLLDAMVLVAFDAWWAAAVCAACMPLTLLAQRRIAGS
ncbi:MAG: hypothetical protein RLZZ238_2134 [Planctomycetota bacterium]